MPINVDILGIRTFFKLIASSFSVLLFSLRIFEYCIFSPFGIISLNDPSSALLVSIFRPFTITKTWRYETMLLFTFPETVQYSVWGACACTLVIAKNDNAAVSPTGGLDRQ